MSLPPTGRPPGRPLYAQAKREVETARSVQETVASHFGPQDGLIELERPFKDLQVLAVKPDRFWKPSLNNSVMVWRDKKTGRFAPQPKYVERRPKKGRG